MNEHIDIVGCGCLRWFPSWTQIQCIRILGGFPTRATQFWHSIPGNRFKFQRLRIQSYQTVSPPPTFQTLMASSGYHPCFWHISYRLEVPTTCPGLQMLVTGPGSDLHFWPTDYKSEHPKTPPWAPLIF